MKLGLQSPVIWVIYLLLVLLMYYLVYSKCYWIWFAFGINVLFANK